MTKNVYAIGLMAYFTVMAVFFVTYIFFRDINYYKNSMMLNAFLLPVIFAAAAVLSVTAYKKYKGQLSFKEAYGRAFIPMFVGGFLSIFSIFLFINFGDRSAKDLLNYQYIESYKQGLEDEYSKTQKILKPGSAEWEDVQKKYAEGKLRIAEKEKKNEDMFSAKYFGYIFAGYCAYFLILSLFFGSFFRSRRVDAL